MWVPSIAGPKRPQDRISLNDAKTVFRKDIHNYVEENLPARKPNRRGRGGASPPAIRRHSFADNGAVDVKSAASGAEGRPPSR